MMSPAMSSATSLGMSALMTVAMMIAMMLPSIAPTLWRHHRHLRAMRMPGAGPHTMLFAAGYAAVWFAIGLAMFATSAALSPMGMAPPMELPLGPRAGAVLLCVGALQLTPWKARQLRRCRHACVTTRPVTTSAVSAWWNGCRFGLDCGLSCAGPMAALLVVGVMDMRAMVLTTVAITAERVLPGGARIARVTGALAVVAGLVMCGRVIDLAL
jgi:Predicted metal-binding integral membrane protein